MAEFQYQGVDKSGKKVNGKLDATTEGDLRMILRGQGIRPVRIGKVNPLQSDLGKFLGQTGSVSLQTLVQFTRQLQVLISSGVPLVQALEILSDQFKEPFFRSVLVSVREKVSGGSYLWESLASYPKIFPKLYVALIRAGESSGSIDQMLKRLSRYLEDADRLRKMLKGAMMYPIAVVSVGVAVIAVMLVFVIPKFEELLKSGGQELPGATQLVISVSHFMVNHFVFIIAAAAGLAYLVYRYARSEEGRAVLDRLMFRAPVFGGVIQKAAVARFSRTMQTLLASGVNLLDAIDICKATVNNAVLEEAVSKIRLDVEAGRSLGAVVGRLQVFPRMAIQMISVGESTGNLDKMLEKVADFYEEEVEAMVGGLSKLIEPMVLVFLGTVVGGLMIAMYLPIFKLAGSAGS